MTPELKNAIRDYLSLGWRLLPVQTNKRPYASCKPSAATNNGRELWKRWAPLEPEPRAVGVLLGKDSGLIVLNVSAGVGMESLEKLCAIAPLPDCPVVITPSGGRHYYFRYDERIPKLDYQKARGILGEGIQILSEGQYSVLPPSDYNDGSKIAKYMFEVDRDLLEKIPPIPEDLLIYILSAIEAQKISSEIDNSDKVPEETAAIFDKFFQKLKNVTKKDDLTLEGEGVKNLQGVFKKLDANFPVKDWNFSIFDLAKGCEYIKIRAHLLENNLIERKDLWPLLALNKAQAVLRPPAHIEDGFQRETLMQMAKHYCENGFEYKEAEKLLKEINKKQCKPPIPHTALQALLMRAYFSTGGEKPVAIPISQICQTNIDPIEFLIPDMIPAVGLVVVAGAKHAGKSFLCLGVAGAVANGSSFANKPEFRAKKGGVLYLALEDTQRRIANRGRQLGFDDLENLFMITIGDNRNVPRVGEEFRELLAENIGRIPDCRLVVIDLLGKVKTDGEGRNSYAHDMQIMGELQRFAIDNAVALMVATHTKKGAEIDVLNRVQGWEAGAADATLIVEKERFTGQDETPGKLYVTSRDFEESEHELVFTARGWEAPVIEKHYQNLGRVKARILETLAEWPKGLTTKQIKEELADESADNVAVNIKRLKDDGLIRAIEISKYVITDAGRVAIGNKTIIDPEDPPKDDSRFDAHIPFGDVMTEP